jgi:class 3 adenylate cyclase
MADPGGPNPARVERRLATILATDCVGFSRRMGVDEEGTARLLRDCRAIIDEILALHGGRIFNTAGDSVLAEFSSPVESVRAALEIQSSLKTRNLSLPPDQQLQFRVGINLGDVITRDEDLLGDAVNIAARLESIADPGSILLSSSVYEQITGKLDVSFHNIGQPSLKNIERPISVYRVGTEGAPRPLLKAPSARLFPRLAWLLVPAFIGVGLVGFYPRWLPSSQPLGAKPAHWLNGRWIGLVTYNPASATDFCNPPDNRCRTFSATDVVGNGTFEGGFGYVGKEGVAVVGVDGEEVTLSTALSYAKLKRSPDGILRGTLFSKELKQDFSLIMRRVP